MKVYIETLFENVGDGLDGLVLISFLDPSTFREIEIRYGREKQGSALQLERVDTYRHPIDTESVSEEGNIASVQHIVPANVEIFYIGDVPAEAFDHLFSKAYNRPGLGGLKAKDISAEELRPLLSEVPKAREAIGQNH